MGRQVCPEHGVHRCEVSPALTSTAQNILTDNRTPSGNTNTSISTVSIGDHGELSDNKGRVSWKCISPSIARVTVTSSDRFIGGSFSGGPDDLFYGVWEYPWTDSVDNKNLTFELKGVGNSVGINWDNARAPFFFTSAGYGVYLDTADMGSFSFDTPGRTQFVFNASSLTYYVITPETAGDFKAIISEYTGLSTRSVMPPDSSYGPTLYSDDFEQDFHGYVTNAQQNYYDVIDHLYYNQIHASAIFADRTLTAPHTVSTCETHNSDRCDSYLGPYGTGNMSWGNFDFDPQYYPDPEQLIGNLTKWGFDFQVRVCCK
jgi:alpha-D-xyloside xylohydrolase